MIRNPLKVGKFYLEAKNKHLSSLRGKHTMRNDLKVKFLKHLNSNKKEKGFTLIELLVVIIIIGLLTAIALPSFLNQSNKAKLSEAKNNVRSASEAQKSFYVEETTFIDNDNIQTLQDQNLIPDEVGTEDPDSAWLEALGVAVDGTRTANYFFQQTLADDGGNLSINGIPATKTMTDASQSNASAAHKAYIGGISVVRGIVDQVYCEAVEAPVNTGETGQTALPLTTGQIAACPDDGNWKSSKPTN